jgi:ABC-type multidrug transport system ATPase subunit
VILVTHHVELVLPGSYYLIRMLDGRIDVQGTVAELRAAGALEGVVKSEEANTRAHGEEQVADKERAEVAAEADSADPVIVAEARDTAKDAKKKPRTLVEAEKREEGSVKWAIYSTYLEAS